MRRAPRYLRPPGISRQAAAAAAARTLTSTAAADRALAHNSSVVAGRIFSKLRYRTTQDAQLEAIIAAVAGGPERNQVFLTMVNKAAAQHHLPWFLKSLRALQVRHWWVSPVQPAAA